MYKQLQKAAGYGEFDVDNFDPDNFAAYSDEFDPDNASGESAGSAATSSRQATPGQKMQINLTITNATAQLITTELFSALDSITTRKKPELAIGNYSMIPLLTFEGLSQVALANTAGFNQAGNLELRGNAGDPKLTVGCGEYPYSSLFESTKTLPFQISFIRLTVDTDNQIDNQITWFKRTFGGKTETNTVSPRAYFKPNQFQGKTIDILVELDIDSESGILYPVRPTESARFSLFIQRWYKPNV